MRLVGAGLAGVLALGALGACSSRPGAAAVVDGRTVSVADLRTALTELSPYLQDPSTSGVLEALVQEQPMIDLAAEHGVGASDEDAEKLLASIAEQAGSKTTTFSPASVGIARASVSLDNLQGLSDADAALAELDERIAALEVKVNPRFGSVGDGNSIAAPVARSWFVTTRNATDVNPTPAPESTELPEQSPAPTATS